MSEYTKREGVETLHERQCLHQKHTKQTMPPSKTHKNTQKCSNLRREVNGQRNCKSGNKGRPQIMWRGRKHRPSHARQILNDYYCGNYDLHYKGAGGKIQFHERLTHLAHGSNSIHDLFQTSTNILLVNLHFGCTICLVSFSRYMFSVFCFNYVSSYALFSVLTVTLSL